MSGVRSWCDAFATNSRWRAHRPLDAIRHLVERARELVDLGTSLQLARPRGQIAGAETLRGRRASRDSGRASDRASATASTSPASRPPSATATIAAVARPTFSCTVSHVPRDPHGADELALVDDRGPLPRRCRLPRPRSCRTSATSPARRARARPPGVPAWRSRSRGPRRRSRRGRCRVGVEDHDPAADVRGVAPHVPDERRRSPRLVRRAGLAFSTAAIVCAFVSVKRLELGAGAVAQHDRERNRERHDHHEQDVGERRDEPRPDLHHGIVRGVRSGTRRRGPS